MSTKIYIQKCENMYVIYKNMCSLHSSFMARTQAKASLNWIAFFVLFKFVLAVPYWKEQRDNTIQNHVFTRRIFENIFRFHLFSFSFAQRIIVCVLCFSFFIPISFHEECVTNANCLSKVPIKITDYQNVLFVSSN